MHKSTVQYVSGRRALAGIALSLALAALPPPTLLATPSPAAAQSAYPAETSPGRDFLTLRKAVSGPFQSLVKTTKTSISLDDLANQIVELSGRVTGRAALPNGVVLMVDTSWGSLNVSVASSNNLEWLDTGSVIRALISVPDSSSLLQLNNIVPMIASAPEGSVKQAEQEDALADQQTAIAAARAADAARAREAARDRRQATSRSAGYDFRYDAMGGRPIAALSPEALSVYGPYRAFIAARNRRLSPYEVDAITTSILYYSESDQLDPRLVIAMIMAESGFDPNSTSRTGAMGLGQLMPETAAGLGVSNAYDPIENIGAAVHILSSHVRTYGGATPSGIVPINTLLLTMAAYNAGSGAVHKYRGVPPYRETQRYVRKVAAFYKQICGG
jgi:soluble lytic murein transglycosylase-like protein